MGVAYEGVRMIITLLIMLAVVCFGVSVWQFASPYWNRFVSLGLFAAALAALLLRTIGLGVTCIPSRASLPSLTSRLGRAWACSYHSRPWSTHMVAGAGLIA